MPTFPPTLQQHAWLLFLNLLERWESQRSDLYEISLTAAGITGLSPGVEEEYLEQVAEANRNRQLHQVISTNEWGDPMICIYSVFCLIQYRRDDSLFIAIFNPQSSSLLSCLQSVVASMQPQERERSTEVLRVFQAHYSALQIRIPQVERSHVGICIQSLALS